VTKEFCDVLQTVFRAFSIIFGLRKYDKKYLLSLFHIFLLAMVIIGMTTHDFV